MALDIVTSAMNMVTAVVNGAKPIIDDHYSQKYENEAKERSRKWLEIQAEPDEIKRANAAYAYLLLLLADAQSPVRGNGANISVPSDILDALTSNTIQLVKSQEWLANLSFKK
jgi:hypothetical protein